MERRRLIAHNPVFKLNLIAHGKRAASCNCNVYNKCVVWWLKQKAELVKTNKSRKTFRGKTLKLLKLVIGKIRPNGVVLFKGHI